MHTALPRLVGAVVLLTAYYHWAFAAPPQAPTDAAVAGPELLRDIEVSQAAYSAGHYDVALGPTQRVSAQLPSQALYFDRLARIHRELGHPHEEARAWEGVFRTSPTPVDACPMLAEAYARVPDQASALGAYERCADEEPDNPDLLLFLGRAYTASGRVADARVAFERALRIAPDYPDLYLLLGVRNFADGRSGEARAQFERFVFLAPERRDEAAVWLERTSPTQP